jgi:hypothetical protein
LPDFEDVDNLSDHEANTNLPENNENASTLRRVIRLERRRVATLEAQMQTMQNQIVSVQGGLGETQESHRFAPIRYESHISPDTPPPSPRARPALRPVTPSKRLATVGKFSVPRKKRKSEELLLEQAKGFMNFPNNIPLKGPAR